jgi:hypothetical protein
MLNIFNVKNPDKQNLGQSDGSTPPEALGRFESYVDPSGEFTSKDLQYGFWWVEHRAIIYQMVVFLLGIFVFATWAFSLWKGGQLAWYAFTDGKILDQRLKTFSNFTLLDARFAPVPLSVLSVNTLVGGVNRTDFIAEIANTNKRFIATFDYTFRIGAATTPVQHAILLPGDDTLAPFQGYEGDASSASPSLEIRNVTWRRISNKGIADPIGWQADRLQFSIDNFVFTQAGSIPQLTAHSIRFTITNQSSFGYKSPLFYVALYTNQALVGVLPLTLTNFQSLDARTVDLRSFVPNLTVTDLKLYPSINVYDPDVYLKPPST